MYAEELARRYPRIRFDPEVLYVDDGQVLTSAGTGAGIDLALHIVRLDYGPAVTNQVARRMVVAPHREGGQSQYVDLPVPEAPYRDGIRPLLEWVRERLDEPLSVEDLARLAAMSPRTLTRRFRHATGTTRSGGSPINASRVPRNCSKRPTFPSTRSPGGWEWAPPPTCVSTSVRAPACCRRRTGAVINDSRAD
jgi:AraC-like DNA-binding protein